ncbi:hypothetical protein HK100_000731, partial [Physocladia obscura]
MDQNAIVVPLDRSDWLGWRQGMWAPHNRGLGPAFDLGLTLLSFGRAAKPNAVGRTVRRASVAELEPKPNQTPPPPRRVRPRCRNLQALRNTEAARKSRVRRADKIDSLILEVDTRKKEKSCLTVRTAVLENDAMGFAQCENDVKRRIAILERQLMESHRALVGR